MCLDRHRRAAVRAVSEVPAEEAAGADLDPGPERRAAWSSVGALLERALGRLSERDRAAVLLRDVEGFSYDEIAAALGMPVGTVKAALHRSRERLRLSLERAGVRP
jgi:RNA polymerase sigma-70 factor (ECF subfamily)